MDEEARNIASITISDTLACLNLGIVVLLSAILAITTRYVHIKNYWLCCRLCISNLHCAACVFDNMDLY